MNTSKTLLLDETISAAFLDGKDFNLKINIYSPELKSNGISYEVFYEIIFNESKIERKISGATKLNSLILAFNMLKKDIEILSIKHNFSLKDNISDIFFGFK